MKIGRNELCPCGSGKKYKKCCANKEVSFKSEKDDSEPTYFNETINNIVINREDKTINISEVIDNYLKVMDYLMHFAVENNIKKIDKLDEFMIVDDFVINIIGDFEIEILNLDSNDYDLKEIIRYLDKLLNTFELDSLEYENNVRAKSNTLFKLGHYEYGEKVMIDYINTHPKSAFAYVELVDDFKHFGMLEKSKEYYDMGMKIKNLINKEVLEERRDFFKE